MVRHGPERTPSPHARRVARRRPSGIPWAAAGGILLVGGATTVALLLLRDRACLGRRHARVIEDLRARIADSGRAQAQVVASSRRVAFEELSAGVAHEVNNPLQSILGYAEILLADAPAAGSPRDELEIIRSEALRARAIVQSLRGFARTPAPARRRTDLTELVSGTVDLMRHDLEHAGVTIEETYGVLPPLELDPAAVRQALLNVLANAGQAIPPGGGTLRVEIGHDDVDAIIAITDTGVGMDPESAARAFTPFFRTRDTHVRTGLGLAVTQGIVEDHGGRVRLTSAPGRGTTVVISLPLEPAITSQIAS